MHFADFINPYKCLKTFFLFIYFTSAVE
uniref:Uncharacterized protein n=1 Tax=Anguilla anguilla TaxID=7936 RepID=A0A0E9U7K6_ANGAN